jgi:hypothetical protein
MFILLRLARVGLVLLLGYSPAAVSDERDEKEVRKFDLILRSEIVIDRPVSDVWPRFLDMQAWMAGVRLQHVEGEVGSEGEVRSVGPSSNKVGSDYLIKTVRITRFKQYVIKITPGTLDYFGFADFSFFELNGATHLVYDIYVESKTPAMTEKEFALYSKEQYENAYPVVAKNNQTLKALVESQPRD